jgi:hypothetical protein
MLLLQVHFDGNDDAEAAHTVTLALWRVDQLSGVIEVDKKLLIRKADMAVGVLLGPGHQHMHKQPLSR